MVALLQQRIEPAYEYLFDKYSRALYGVILDIIPDREIAADTLQEVFLKIWRLIDKYDPGKGTLFTWMFQIARSTSIDMVRSKNWLKTKLNVELSDSHMAMPDNNKTAFEDIGLRKAIKGLRQEHSVLIELSYFQGYTQEEIAQMLQLPLGTVKTRLRAALIQLRKFIAT
ncbi:sigma-70 family RNA polymerase sigma factor [Chitinophaga sp. Cy-1792]|uniref:RNA polymerase sigma factor n=1 Tax=Chitinophaga sp. Cy-1792 TaxID=2608339 RepID=UPI001F046E5E|nr:sigma-70 family RNA polymerase sigma factor [Chitinophaga sp. Cy-1792]